MVSNNTFNTDLRVATHPLAGYLKRWASSNEGLSYGHP